MNHNFDNIKSISEDLVNRMLGNFPNCHYTVKIFLWDDDTMMIQCVSMTHNDVPEDKEKIRTFTWYDNKIKYEEEIKQRQYGTS